MTKRRRPPTNHELQKRLQKVKEQVRQIEEAIAAAAAPRIVIVEAVGRTMKKPGRPKTQAVGEAIEKRKRGGQHKLTAAQQARVPELYDAGMMQYQDWAKAAKHVKRTLKTSVGISTIMRILKNERDRHS